MDIGTYVAWSNTETIDNNITRCAHCVEPHVIWLCKKG